MLLDVGVRSTQLNSGGNITGYLDPTVAFDPSFNSGGFDFEFSDGIGNTAATPLPAALPMFVAGLSALGFLGWQRKRKLLPA